MVESLLVIRSRSSPQLSFTTWAAWQRGSNPGGSSTWPFPPSSPLGGFFGPDVGELFFLPNSIPYSSGTWFVWVKPRAAHNTNKLETQSLETLSPQMCSIYPKLRDYTSDLVPEIPTTKRDISFRVTLNDPTIHLPPKSEIRKFHPNDHQLFLSMRYVINSKSWNENFGTRKCITAALPWGTGSATDRLGWLVGWSWMAHEAQVFFM